jgi:hypothetical protein
MAMSADLLVQTKPVAFVVARQIIIVICTHTHVQTAVMIMLLEYLLKESKRHLTREANEQLRTNFVLYSMLPLTKLGCAARLTSDP